MSAATDHAGGDGGEERPAEGVTVGGPEAARLTELLETLAELPSTPSLVGEEARYRASELSWVIPPPHGHRESGTRPPTGPIVLDRLAVTGIAGLLDLLSGMPSTPPGVADEALAQADVLWRLLDEQP